MNDEDYMRRALELAEKGRGHVSPNPMVGAVIVRDGRIISSGYHHKIGDLHAERDALSRCTEPTQGATIYVTLEPCCHYGKQPPCTDALIAAGFSRVVVGSGDPNPLVAGKGLKILRDAGIEVTEHVLEDECRALNEVFFHYIQTRRPLVIMKYAMTLDGKIACYTGESRWVTGEQARRHVHELRHACSAIMVGIGTVLADDPLLTCRLEDGVDPIRVVCDTALKIPIGSQIVQTAHEVPTLIATCSADAEKRSALEARGCELVDVARASDEHLDLDALVNLLGAREIDSVILEGGATLNWAAVKAGIVDKVLAYLAPKFFGGAQAKTPVGGQGFASPADALELRIKSVGRLGDDLLVESEVAR